MRSVFSKLKALVYSPAEVPVAPSNYVSGTDQPVLMNKRGAIYNDPSLSPGFFTMNAGDIAEGYYVTPYTTLSTFNSVMFGIDYSNSSFIPLSAPGGILSVSLSGNSPVIMQGATSVGVGSNLTYVAASPTFRNNAQKVLASAPPLGFEITDSPAVNTATVCTYTGATGMSCCISSLSIQLITDNSAQTSPVLFVIRDGASGTGAIIWQAKLMAGANQTAHISLTGLNLFTTQRVVTLESTTAPGAGHYVVSNMSGFLVNP